MPTYMFNSTYRGRGHVYIEADSLEEARQRAEQCDFEDDDVIECDLWDIDEDSGREA